MRARSRRRLRERTWLALATKTARRSYSPVVRRTGSPVGEPVDDLQFEGLKEWRAECAEGKPAYLVATNAVLEEVLRRRPRSANDLIEIDGIGPVFCERYGLSLLAVLDTLEALLQGEQSEDPRTEMVALASEPAPT